MLLMAPSWTSLPWLIRKNSWAVGPATSAPWKLSSACWVNGTLVSTVFVGGDPVPEDAGCPPPLPVTGKPVNGGVGFVGFVGLVGFVGGDPVSEDTGCPSALTSVNPETGMAVDGGVESAEFVGGDPLSEDTGCPSALTDVDVGTEEFVGRDPAPEDTGCPSTLTGANAVTGAVAPGPAVTSSVQLPPSAALPISWLAAATLMPPARVDRSLTNCWPAAPCPTPQPNSCSVPPDPNVAPISASAAEWSARVPSVSIVEPS